MITAATSNCSQTQTPSPYQNTPKKRQSSLSRTQRQQKIKGTKLEPLMFLLATQPDSLHDTITSTSKEVLALSTKISQRGVSHLRFNEPMINPDDRGKPVLDPEANEPQTIAFIPRSIRTKNLCRTSANVNEDLQLIDALKATQDDHKAYLTTSD